MSSNLEQKKNSMKFRNRPDSEMITSNTRKPVGLSFNPKVCRTPNKKLNFDYIFSDTFQKKIKISLKKVGPTICFPIFLRNIFFHFLFFSLNSSKSYLKKVSTKTAKNNFQRQFLSKISKKIKCWQCP